MKLSNQVAQSIRAYPILYRDVTYEKSRLKVLNHLFLAVGNGFGWVKGELVEFRPEPKTKKVSVRRTFPPTYFTDSLMVDFRDLGERDTFSREAWHPYDLCEYSRLFTIPDDVQDDWLSGALEAHGATEEFYSRPFEDLVGVFYERRRPTTSDQIQEHLQRYIPEQKRWLKVMGERLSLLRENRR